MLRLTLLLLCLMLAAAAAGRYKAEAAVRETRNELRRLEKEKANELSKIQVLRAEVASLERPERLATIAKEVTDLAPLTGAQLLTAEEFQLAFGQPDGAVAEFDGVERPIDVAQADAPAMQ